MKKIAILILASLLFMVGCQDDNSILEPTNDVANSLNKGRVILSDGLRDSGIDISSDNDKLSIISKNFTVDGTNGDVLVVSETYRKNGKIVSMSAKLTIPQNAFKGKLTFDMIFDFDNYSVQLYPTPFTFDKPVLLDLGFVGVDFSTLDAANLGFNYLDGETESLKYSSMNINENLGILKILEVEIPHFSRYGWTRIK
ncbi:MAG: hypothetical protein H6609_16130 [Ignavibacteriales bacterium]|nr:hypothetical protein [Ignavibacteriales bacterium]